MMKQHTKLPPLKSLQSFIVLFLCLLVIHVGQAQHISDFTSIPNASPTPDFKIPSTHDFQYLTYETENGALTNFDFTAFIPTAGSSSVGHLSINHEISAGGVSVYDISQDQNTKSWALSNKIDVRYGQVNRPCSGLVTSWGAVLACEESNNGRVLEVNPVNGQSIWRHQLGRLGHENVAEHRTNQRTFYTGEDTGASDDVLLKFVADSPADLSSGSLYTLQTNGTTGTWLPIPNTSTTDTDDVALAAGASGFAGIEDVEIHPITGQVYFAVKNEQRVYRFTEGNDLGAGGVTNFEVFAETGPSYDINGADNMAFDDLGNLYVLQDRFNSNSNIYVFENGHTLQNPQVRLFGRAPSGAEPTGITFTPDFKYLFMSMQHPSGNNSLGQPDFFNNTVPNNRDFAIVIARNESWASNCNAPINLFAAPTFNSALLTWTTAGTGAQNYRVEYRRSTINTWTLASANNPNGTITISNLDSSTDYIWRVRSNCTGATSTYAQSNFTTQAATTCNPPINPTTISTSSSSGTVSWAAATNEATSWRVEYKLQSSNTWSLFAANLPVSTTQATITGLQADSNYDWRVRGNCGNIATDYAVGTFNTVTVVSAPNCLPNNWNFMEIEAKWQSDAATYTAIVNAFPDNGTWEGYSLNVRWSGIPRRYIDVYYDNAGTELSNGLHSARHRTRSRCNTCTNDLTSLQNGAWTYQWEKVQYKSNPSRYDAIWFREEQGDCELIGECSCSDENTIMAGACQHEATDRLLADHPLFDFTTNAPISTVTQYRYRIELIKNGTEQYEISLDRVDDGNGNITYENELELIVPQGSRTLAQLDELFRLTSVLEANQNYSLTPSTVSKGGTPVPPQSLGDADGDGICDAADNCPNVSNANQANNDNDYHGNACDNCDDDINNDQLDSDNDGIGDVCEPPVVCDPVSVVFANCEGFETDLGLFSQTSDDDTDWTRKSGSTSSSLTGPTSANEGSYYMYVEASSPNFPSKVAKLQSNCITIDEPTLSFRYHMYGSTMGSLQVNLINNNTNQSTTVFTRSGDQGNQWLTANINLASYQGQEVILEFVGTTGTSFRSDIAIDNICFGAPICPPPSALNTINVTSNSALVRWTPDATATSTRVEFKKSSDANWSIGITGTSDSQYTLTGLMPNTLYDWRVRSACGAVGPTAWVASTFMTIGGCEAASIAFAQCEGFETNLGIFSQATDDDTNWTRKTGGTSSSLTGPTSADEGSYYMYIESSSPNFPSKVAKLQSSCLTIDKPTLSFRYHMYGSSMGTLQVNLINQNSNQSTSIFTKSGNQGNQWLTADINLSPYQGQDVILEFFGTTGTSYRSDIAIDRICFGSAPVCGSPTNLNETNITSNSATLRWTSEPAADVTIVEYRKVGDTGFITATNGTTNSQVNITNLMPDTDYEWYAISLCGGSLSTEVYDTFRTLPSNLCASVSSFSNLCESFENGIGGFSQPSSIDDIDWTLKSNNTSSSGTGPTSAFDGSFYMYVEASSPNYPGKVARLESPCLTMDDPNNSTLSFRYHMYGSTMGKLEVNVKFGGVSVEVFSNSGDKGNVWNEAQVDLSGYPNQDIIIEFVATTGNGFRSDIAIDKVCLTSSSCTPSTSSTNLQNYSLSEFFINTPVPQSAGITGHDNGNLFVIDDNAQRIVQFSPSGAIIGQSSLSGFQDTEGIAYMGNNEFVIIEEVRRRLVFVTVPANNMPGTINYPSSSNYIFMNSGGMEGVAYDKVTQTIFVSTQQSNLLYKYNLGDLRSGAISPFLMDNSQISSPLIHGLELLPNGNLLVLGSNAALTSPDKTLFEIDLCGNLISKKELNSLPSTSGGVNVTASKFDGIAIGNDGCIYATADLTPGKLYKLCAQGSGGLITDCSRNSGIETSCSYSESFDAGFGLWFNPTGDDLNWLRRTNSTSSSNTGPSAPSNGSHYTYIESSTNGVGYPNKIAYLESPCFQIPLNHAGLFLEFKYHMYGSTMGTLSVEFTTDDVNWTSIWSQSGNQGNQWNSEFITLPQSYNGQTVRLRFKAVTGGSYRSDFAIDNVNAGCTFVNARHVDTREQPSISMATDLQVFPNPVHDYLNIEYHSGSLDKIDIHILNPMGQVISRETHSKTDNLFQKQINVSGLANGMYHVIIKEGDQHRSARFVVTK